VASLLLLHGMIAIYYEAFFITILFVWICEGCDIKYLHSDIISLGGTAWVHNTSLTPQLFTNGVWTVMCRDWHFTQAGCMPASQRRVVWVHKTSLTPPLFIEYQYQTRNVSCYVYVLGNDNVLFFFITLRILSIKPLNQNK